MQMQRSNDECKKNKKLIVRCDTFIAIEQSMLLHVVAVMSHCSCRSSHPGSQSTDEHKRLLRTWLGWFVFCISVATRGKFTISDVLRENRLFQVYLIAQMLTNVQISL